MKTRHPGVKWSRDRWRHVTPKVKLVTPLPFRRHIFVTVTDKRIVSMDLQEKMGSPESNGHVTDDVTWPQKVKLVTPLPLRRNISVPDRRIITMDHPWKLDPRESKGHVTDDVTWPQKVKLLTPVTLQAPYLRNGAREKHGHYVPPIKTRLPWVEWTRDRWRHVTPKGQTRDPITFEALYVRNGGR